MSIAETDPDAFTRRYGALFEHSPGVVVRAAARLPLGDVWTALMAVVHDAAPPATLEAAE